jgi:rhodanese-related sulfurtransferase
MPAAAASLTSSSLDPGDLLTPHQLLRLTAYPASISQGAPTLVIDLRSRSSYRHRHIPGSHNIPSGWLISGEPPDGDLILVGESTRHSSAAIEQLQAQGYARKIRHLAGGFKAWQVLELPMAGQCTRRFQFPGQQKLKLIISGLLSGPRGRSRSRAGA